MNLGVQKNKYFYSINIDNNLDNIPILIKSFEKFAQTYEIPQHLIPKINAILTELVSGVILYAFEQDTKHQVYTTFEIFETGKFTLKIKYEGFDFNPFHTVPFNKDIPLEERTTGGLGIHLVQRLMDEYSYQKNNQWNIVQMTKNQI